MSVSRQAFYETLGVMRGLSNDTLLTDGVPSAVLHNNRARILRNGLIISSFSLMEAYLEERLEEKLLDLSKSKLSYAMFGDSLRKFLTIDAINGLVTRINHTNKADRQSYAEAGIAKAAGVHGSPPSYSGLGFSPRGSNVSSTDIKSLLTAFGIKDGWGLLSKICGNLGASRVSLKADFDNFQRARHTAAHDSSSMVASGDLETHLGTALLTGMSTDIAISTAIGAFVKQRTVAAAEAAANLVPFAFRFVDEQLDGLLVERITLTGNVIKRYADRSTATREVLARKKAVQIVFRDVSLVPIELM